MILSCLKYVIEYMNLIFLLLKTQILDKDKVSR